MRMPPARCSPTPFFPKSSASRPILTGSTLAGCNFLWVVAAHLDQTWSPLAEATLPLPGPARLDQCLPWPDEYTPSPPSPASRLSPPPSLVAHRRSLFTPTRPRPRPVLAELELPGQPPPASIPPLSLMPPLGQPPPVPPCPYPTRLAGRELLWVTAAHLGPAWLPLAEATPPLPGSFQGPPWPNANAPCPPPPASIPPQLLLPIPGSPPLNRVSPCLILMVKKKDGSWRFCMDYRSLNKEDMLFTFGSYSTTFIV